MAKKKYTIKISMKSKRIVIETLDTTRISYHSMGTYLIKYRPKEILITQRAKVALMKRSEIQNEVGLEFSKGNVLGWASPTPNFIVPLKHISVPEHVKKIIEKFDVIE